MSLKIDQDHRRFRQIVRGKIRDNLRRYISQGEILGRKGKDVVSIPIPQIDIPRFRFGDKQQGGVGQGDGENGDPISGQDGQEGQSGQGKAGKDGADHALEVDVTLDELAEILGEELALPDIENRGKSVIQNKKDRYVGIRRVGPDSLLHFKRTYREALKRQIASGTFAPGAPNVVPIPEDKRFRSWKTQTEPVANAVILYMMDVSGSMGDEQKEIVRIESFWIDAWLTKQYKGLESRYIIHDAMAREVDRETFFHTRESGGTMISSAYKLCAQLIDEHYPADEWNIYPFHFSDGDNWSMDDTLSCVEILKNRILPRVNMFAYGQVESPYGSGQFIKDLREHLGQDERVVVSEIRDKDAIVGSIKDFLGKGKLGPMSEFALRTELPSYLREWKDRIEGIARGYGLDFFPTIFEILSYDQMNEIAAYTGFPNRYPHWRFGMEYEQLSKSYEYGLSKIYEMVINNNPSYAYLLEGNSLTEQKLVMAHVLGHVDFFKNNFTFRTTDLDASGRITDPIRRQEPFDPNRKWIDKMANNGTRIRRHMDRHGVNKIEEFIDQCLSLENLLDPWKPFSPPPRPRKEEPDEPREVPRLKAKGYMEKYINPEEYLEEQRQKVAAEAEREKRFPERPERDVLAFLLAHAPLERWEHDCLEVIREEAYYFVPQMQTKIMNEGWASYWHSRMMTEKVADASEIIDYADRNASVMATGKGQLNPYKLGVELYRHIEERWNKGQFGREWDDCDDADAKKHWDLRLGVGREKIFEVRRLYNDVTFIDEFLTPEFALEQKLYSFGYSSRNDRFEIETREFRKVKEKLLFQLTNAGNPVIYVVDANFENKGELLLRHEHVGLDLRGDYAKETLRALVRVWKRPVCVATVMDQKPVLLRYDGTEHTSRAYKA